MCTALASSADFVIGAVSQWVAMSAAGGLGAHLFLGASAISGVTFDGCATGVPDVAVDSVPPGFFEATGVPGVVQSQVLFLPW